jgi:hypothetical protein
MDKDEEDLDINDLHKLFGGKGIHKNLIDVMEEMPFYCRCDIIAIGPGWGYVEPSGDEDVGGEVNVISKYEYPAHIDSTSEETISGVDRDKKTNEIPIDKLRDLSNWDYSEQMGYVAKSEVKVVGEIRSFGSKRHYHKAWIPSEPDGVLQGARILLELVDYEIKDVNLVNVKDDFVVGIDLACGTKVRGRGELFLEACLRLYIECWKLYYEMMTPSLSCLNGDIEMSSYYNGEPTVECYKWHDTFGLKGSLFRRYAEDHESYGNHFIRGEEHYMGKVSFLEGDFHIVYRPIDEKEKGPL